MRHLILIFILQGCTVSVGIGHQFSIDEEIMENPVGIVRAELEINEHNSVECQLVSSMPMIDDIIQFDYCAYMYTF